MRSFLRCLLLSISAGLLLPSPAAGADDGGVLLSEYLDRINALGQSVIFSSDLVTADMRLGAAPTPSPTQAELRELLRPFGLTVTLGPSNSWLVVESHDASEDQGTAAEPLTPIPEIIVTSSLRRLDYSNPTAHTFLDRELAARIPTTAEEAVRLTNRLPGTASGGVSAQNHIRGGDVNEVLFLLDGLRLYEPFHLKDFQATATIINAAAIGGIDFYTGAYPAHYGDRMSGVMNIELREPEKPVQTELALSFFNTSVLSLGTFGDVQQGDWLVSARRGNLDLVVDVIDPDFGSPDYQDYLAHIGYEFGPRMQLSANLLYSDDKLQLTELERGEQATASYTNQVAWLRWRADWTAALSSDTILAVSDITNRRTGSVVSPGIVSGNLDERQEFSALEIRQDWRWIIAESWMLRAGFNVKNLDAEYEFSSQQTIAPPFDTILDNQPATIRDFDLAPAGAQYAAFAEFRWRPADRWVLDFGIRWDQQNYTTADDDKQYSPRASILYQPSARSELRFGWGQYYQAQEINELQVSDGITDYFPAQQAEHFVLNFRHKFNAGLTAEATAYRKSFRKLRARFENSFNTLTLVPELQFDRIMVAPTGAEATGVELMVNRGSADDNLFWWLGYSWSSIEDTTTGGDVIRSWDQTHTLKGGLSWRWGAWDFSAAGEVHTGWPRTTMSGELVLQPGGSELLVLDVSERNASRYSAYHALDMRISRDFELSRGELTAFLEISNLYDHANPCCVEYSLRADGSLASRQRHWLPLLPSLGVIWRF
ncbi:MAG: TonB-dependent receptor [Woeseiaceae bacterium]|nr:TonB-dependent receptor [Woeseiaceae bacterium]